jgi:ABC-2 type transport system permease protein
MTTVSSNLLTPAAMPASLASRVRWTLIDGWTLIRREFWHVKAQPAQLLSPLIVSVALVLLFGYVFGSAITVPGGGSYRSYLLPGLFTMASATPVMINATRIAREKSLGVMDRFRSMPMARLAVPIGQTGADILTGPVSLLLMAATGLVVGWRADNGVGHAVEAFALLILFRYSLSWVGVYIGLAVKSETLDSMGALFFPIIMISNAFVPTNHMPTWLRTIANWNPISAVTQSSRELFGNPGATLHSGVWPLEHPMVATVLWSIAFLVIFAVLSTRRFISANS